MMLAAVGLTKSYAGTPVLGGLDLEVSAGSLTAVLGPSGCGKTTMLRLLAGFERADAGSVTLGGRLLEGPGSHVPAERRRIGLVPQEGALFPHLRVAANIGFGLPRRRRAERVGELLELLDLGGLERRFPHQLSGGQQQRVALARALAPAPAVVLLDEPFDALDAGLRVQVRAEVRRALKDAGATALIVTHDQDEALSLADRVAVMRAGRIAQIAAPKALYREPVDAEIATFVGEAVMLEAERRGEEALTALGPLPLRGDHRGAPRLVAMLRPEQISLGDPAAADAPGIRATVRAVAFHGHDALAELELPGAAGQLQVRTTGHQAPDLGEVVAIGVAGSAWALPAGASPAGSAAVPLRPAVAAGRAPLEHIEMGSANRRRVADRGPAAAPS